MQKQKLNKTLKNKENDKQKQYAEFQTRYLVGKYMK